MKHASDSQITAYLDGELAVADHEEMRSHLQGCERCKQVLAGMSTAQEALGSLQAVSMSPEERRELRTRLLERPSKKPFFTALRVWSLAGGVALLTVGFIGFAIVNRSESERVGGSATLGVPRQPESSVEALAFQTQEELEEYVLSDSAVTSKIGTFTVSDVGAKQQEYLDSFGDSSEPETAADTSESLSQDEGASKRAFAGSTAPTASLSGCLGQVLRSQGYPMIPLVAREVSWQGQPAWLLVYAWTALSTSDAKLDRIQIWVVEQTGCGTLAYSAGVANRN